MRGPFVVKLPEGWFTPPELELLAQCAREAPDGDLVEIGVFKGRSATVLAAERGERLLWLVDNMSVDGADTATWPSGWSINWILIDERPVGLDITEPITLLHHDADHSEDVVYTHLLDLGERVMLGGFICLHDYWGMGQAKPEYPGVATAWSRFRDDSDFTWADAGRADSLQCFRRVQ